MPCIICSYCWSYPSNERKEVQIHEDPRCGCGEEEKIWSRLCHLVIFFTHVTSSKLPQVAQGGAHILSYLLPLSETLRPRDTTKHEGTLLAQTCWGLKSVHLQHKLCCHVAHPWHPKGTRCVPSSLSSKALSQNGLVLWTPYSLLGNPSCSQLWSEVHTSVCCSS